MTAGEGVEPFDPFEGHHAVAVEVEAAEIDRLAGSEQPIGARERGRQEREQVDAEDDGAGGHEAPK
jgi:hypothetical protein